MEHAKKMCYFRIYLVYFVAITGVCGEVDTSFVFPLAGVDVSSSDAPGATDQNGNQFTLGPRHYLAKMSIFPGTTDATAQSIESQQGDFILDTGSGVAVLYDITTGITQECSAAFEEKNGLNYTSPDLKSSFTLAKKDASICKNFVYSLSNSQNGTCPFKTTYAGGESIEGFVISNAYVYAEGSKQVLGNSDTTKTSGLAETLTTLNDGVAPLYSPLSVGRIDSALSCGLYPGILGMDMSESAFAPQLVSSGKIGGVVFSICVSREGMYGDGQEAGYMVMGPGVPSALEQNLSTFPLYNGQTLQRIKTSSQQFQEDIPSLDVRGLETHFFLITDTVAIGDQTFEGPLDTLVDTGYSGIAFEPDIIDSMTTQIAANAGKKGYTIVADGCILVGAVSNEDAMALANDIAPTIQLAFSDTVSFNVEGTDYMSVNQVELGKYEICSTATVSQSNEPAILGTAFFINKFVQFDWENQQIRIADVSNCSDTSTFIAQTTASELSGNYSFPYTVESQAIHPRDRVLSLVVAFILSLALLI